MQQSSKKQSAKPPYSETISANNFLFIAGQVGVDRTTGILVNTGFEDEAIQLMNNIESLLHKEKLKFSDLVSVTVYLKTMNNYQLLNKVYATFFEGNFPARVCIAVADLPLNANVEIAAIASIRKQV
jgi:reactive intermediate/imine deaminase